MAAAHLVRTESGAGGYTGWHLQAQFRDGTAFVVDAPGALTADEVADLAEQVTYTP
jgi:hypothetical protein